MPTARDSGAREHHVIVDYSLAVQVHSDILAKDTLLVMVVKVAITCYHVNASGCEKKTGLRASQFYTQ